MSDDAGSPGDPEPPPRRPVGTGRPHAVAPLRRARDRGLRRSPGARPDDVAPADPRADETAPALPRTDDAASGGPDADLPSLPGDDARTAPMHLGPSDEGSDGAVTRTTPVAALPPVEPLPPVGPPPSGGTAARRTGPASPTPRAPTRVAAGDYAATSTVVAALRGRVAARRRPWTWMRAARFVTATAAVLVVLVNGLAWGAGSWMEAAIRQIGALDPESTSIVDAAGQQGDQNFLVVGSDTRAGALPAEDAGDVSDVPGARSDTVMVVHVPADRARVTVVSFPRDLEIERPACNRFDPVTGRYSPEVVPRTPRVKLNSAYAAGGPLCVTRTVQELSGLRINHFLGIDFQGFQEMVEAVGGVGICVDRPIRDSVLGPIVDRAGPTTLTGGQALAFVRARHVEGDPTSDYGRIERQQRFLGALLRETLSTGTLLDVGRLRGLVDAVGRSTFGDNVGAEQLIVLGRSLGSVDPGAVTFTSAPTTGTANDRGNEVLRRADARALFSAIIRGEPLPGQAGAAPPPVLTPPQVLVRLAGADDGTTDSEDGGGDTGAGTATSSSTVRGVGEALAAQGFRVVLDPAAAGADRARSGRDGGGAGDGNDRDRDRAVIRFSSDLAPAAATLARSLRGATLAPAAGAGQLVLVVGPEVGDADDLVVGPSAPAVTSSPPAPVLTAADSACA